jgi:cytochrome c2
VRTFVFLLCAVAGGNAPARAEPGTARLPGERITFNAVGPPLGAVRTKIADPNWLVAWLLKPSQVRPGTAMPDFDLSAAEAQAVAKYLYAGTAAAAPSTPRWQGGDAPQGEKLFVARGCRGCHAITADETSISPRVPNLAGVGLKLRGSWLFAWLKSPRTYNPHTAMPQLVLSDDDIRHLVAFLLTRRQGAELVAAAPRFNPGADAAAGRKVIETYECFKCHQLKGFEPPAPAFELATDESRESTLRNGRYLVDYYNCRGCHFVDGSGGNIKQFLERKSFAPPTLEGEGARVQTSWLIGFLQQPSRLRPWLEMRMPTYGFSAAEASALAKFFAASAGVDAADEPHDAVPPDVFTRGLRRFAHFKCVQCHPTNAGRERPQDVDPENLSINLTLAKSRLRPSWIRKFLTGPKAILGTQTRMPDVFYTIDGIPKVEHPTDDIQAIAAYLLQMTEPPEATLAKLEAERKHEREAQPDWTTYQY